MNFLVLFPFLICLLPVRGQEANLLISVNPDTQMLVDSLGRERFFHGTNVVVKHPPFHPETTGFGPTTFSEKDMQILQELGLNSIRLGMMLPGYVPKRGQYNETYLQVIQSIVETAAKYGIYTLLDMHQDVFSPKFCVEGMPDWIVNTGDAKPFPYPFTTEPFKINPSTGYPYPEDCQKFPWGNYYFTEAACKAFQSLYSNVDGLLDEWAMFWKNTAKGFKGYNSVIGYELINEPFCGDIYKNPLLLVPGVADRLNLQPAYDVLQKAIREVDELHSIFFEGVTWDFFAVGFTKVPGGAKYQNRSVLSYHYYEPPDFSKTLSFAARMEDLKRLKCGGFLSEMYTVGKDFQSMYKMFDLCDQHKQSWHGWMYKPYGCIKQHLACTNETNHSGAPGEIVVQNTSRTYPQAVAGFTKNYKFDQETKNFVLTYEISSVCESRRTEIYFNKKLHYPNGYNVTLTPYDHVTVTLSSNGFLFYLDHDEILTPGTEVSFQLNAFQ
ncbi:endoglycoceramidase-like isoform X1 [Hydractinia symbiolongicarpus]|uniref:endoglycoceramidase-like isoform X1 n=1 Tax=Hydractinia symbiolongicarpus TaxID=13093 RepID=UPI00254E51AF|nr:endoglycoceramidase-like isoform X1 [Hydractinia symbiolongicarpus]